MAKRETQQTVNVGLWGKRAGPAHLPWDAVTTVKVTFRGQLATT